MRVSNEVKSILLLPPDQRAEQQEAKVLSGGRNSAEEFQGYSGFGCFDSVGLTLILYSDFKCGKLKCSNEYPK